MRQSGRTQDHPADLPEDLAERLRQLARTETATSRPWPRVELALKRSHQRRVRGVAALAAVGVLIVGTAVGVEVLPSSSPAQPASPAATTPPAPTPTPSTPAEAGFTGSTGGSLGTDSAWLQAFRTLVLADARSDQQKIASPKDVLVLWAGDLNGSRYATVLYSSTQLGHPHKHSWFSADYTGIPGAPGNAMQAELSSSADSNLYLLGPFGSFTAAPRGAPGYPAVAMVTAPRAHTVEVAATRRFSPTGQVTTTWAPLQKQGSSTWVGRLNAGEYFLSDYRVDGHLSGNSSSTFASGPNLASVAAPGTSKDGLTNVVSALRTPGASNQEIPVFAATLSAGKDDSITAGVLRSPDNGYVFGLVERRPTPDDEVSSLGAVSHQPFATPAAFMAAACVDNERCLVIAPAGATTVRIQDFTATVHNRLAVVTVPASAQGVNDDSVNLTTGPVQALDANGKVITQVTPLPSDSFVDSSGI